MITGIITTANIKLSVMTTPAIDAIIVIANISFSFCIVYYLGVVCIDMTRDLFLSY